MKIGPKDLQKTSMKLFEKFQEANYGSGFAYIWSRRQEILIAAIAGLVIGVIIMFMVLR